MLQTCHSFVNVDLCNPPVHRAAPVCPLAPNTSPEAILFNMPHASHPPALPVPCLAAHCSTPCWLLTESRHLYQQHLSSNHTAPLVQQHRHRHKPSTPPSSLAQSYLDLTSRHHKVDGPHGYRSPMATDLMSWIRRHFVISGFFM